MSSSSFLVASSGSSMYTKMSSANSDSLTFSFLICIPLLFLLSLLWLGLPKLCWIKGVRLDILNLFLILEGLLSAFHHWVCRCRLAVDLLYIAFIMLRFMPSIRFLESCHKWVLFCQKLFMHCWDDHMVFILQFVNGCITWISLWMLKYSCIPGLNPTWSWCMIF